VGGGYESCDLSDISLEWMLSEARTKNLHIYKKHKITRNPKLDGFMNDSQKGFLGKLYRTEERKLTGKIKQARVHKSVIQRRDAGMGYDPWILKGNYRVD